METTPAHQAIFDLVQQGVQNAAISAVAGSGKTTTIVRALQLIKGEKVLFLAFNKRIVEELQRRVPANVQVKTLNALGHRAYTQHMRDRGVVVKLDAEKVRNITKYMLTESEMMERGSKVQKLVRLAKSNGMIPGNPRSLCDNAADVWIAMGNHHDVFESDDDIAGIVEAAHKVLIRSCEMEEVIDFDDQLLLTHAVGAKLETFQRTFVDEAQDLSRLQHELVAKCLGATGRLYAVGDPNQAIYGFRGADSSSMDTLIQRFECVSLPLHVSYRCPQNVVKAAQTFVPHIQAHESAPVGTVDLVPRPFSKHNPAIGDMVVCRITAPVVRAAYACLRAGVPAIVLGRDIGSGLLALIRKLRAGTITDLLTRLDRWEEKEIARAIQQNNDSKQASIHDKAECLRILAGTADDIATLQSSIESLFDDAADPKRVVTCCTVHKSKGLEAERVIILHPELLPARWAKQPWQQQQERNIAYVAYTRAKDTLVTAVVSESDEVQANGRAPIRAARGNAGPPVAMVPVYGRTYPVKDRLRDELGAQWDREKKVWMVPENLIEQATNIVNARR